METNKKIPERNKYAVVVGQPYSHYKIELINIKTGDVEQTIPTDLRIEIKSKHYSFGLALVISAGYDKANKTYIQTHVIGNLTATIPQKAITNVFAEYRKVYAAYQNHFDSVNYNELYKEQHQRQDLRREVLKQEEAYKKKLLRDELKRVAKENVDALRPPITDLVPKANVIALDNTIEQEEN